MEDSTQIIKKLSDLAFVVLDKLKAEQTDITLDFQDVSIDGPGPQGKQGHWRLNGKLSVKTLSKGSKQG